MTQWTIVLSLADSRLPTGGHVHSGGVEEAISSGLVVDIASLEAYLRRRILTSALVGAGISAAVCRGDLEFNAAEDEVDSRTPSPAARIASRKQGRGMLRLARYIWDQGQWDTLPVDPHFASIAGLVGKVAGLSPFESALVVVYTTMTGTAVAAQRLLALDPAEVSAMTFRLSELCDKTAAEATESLSALSDPLLDVLAERHCLREQPLFVS
ncbi:MAG: urease accessory protein UreF [Mycobacteriaceae bacterium]